MGGTNSGSWYRWNKKALTMEQKRIDIRWLKKQNYLQPGLSGPLSWSCRGEQTGSISFHMEEGKMVLNYRQMPRGGDWEDVKQNISIERTPCNYGGYRKWFRCPKCHKRVGILYDAGKYFLCRHCCNLTYESCNEIDIERIINKSYKLRKKLGGVARLHEWIPDKPKGMHHKTYNKIKTEIHRLEDLAEQGMIDRWGMAF